MDPAELKDILNSVRQPTYTRVSELRPGIPYRVIRLEKTTTRFGETVAATLEGLIGDDFYLRVFLPSRFLSVLSEGMLATYNNEETPRLSLQYNGRGKGIQFV